MPARLSAVLIVRDEAGFLPGCLESLAGTVDELVIVDTGSTDATVAVAIDAGARVVHFPWIDDFAAARNAGIDAATGEWILYIDADERLRPGDPDALWLELAASTAEAATVQFHQRPGWTAYREYRLFRNDPRIRFEGGIHETILPALHAMGALGEQPDVVATGAVIDHLGYEGDRTRKWARNLPMLERDVERYPTRVYLWHDLGRALHGLGRVQDAEAAWWRGVEVATANGTADKVQAEDVLPFLDLIVTRLEAGGEVAELIDMALRYHSDNHALQWLRARWLMNEGRHADSLAVLEGLAAVDVGALAGGPLAYELAMFETTVPAAIALCLFKLARFDESAAAYDALAARCDEPARVLEYRARAAVARGRVIS